jgi:hypothetical protein
MMEVALRKIKWIAPIVLILSSPFSARSQSAPLVPKIALFGGYTIVRNQFTATGSTFDLNGWDVSIERKVAPWVGLTFDVSQQHGIRSGAGFPEHEKNTFALFGPQISPPVARRVIPFGHVLFGAVYGTGLNFVSGPPEISTALTFTAAVGGGVDIKIFGPLWLRAIQADYVPSKLDDDHRTKARISAGIALRL